MNYIILDD